MPDPWRAAAAAFAGACCLLAVWAAGFPAASVGRVVDPQGSVVDALQGVVVWERHPAGRDAVLMRRAAGRTSRVPGVSPGNGFRSLDLGIDGRGRVVAVYVRCDDRGLCRGPFVADVRAGGERRLPLRRRAGCTSIKSVSVWQERVAYVRSCRPGAGSGVYVARNGVARRLIPLNAAEAGITPQVDLAPGLLAAASDRIGVRVASIGAPNCQGILDAVSRHDFGPLHASAGRLWWARRTATEFGGGRPEIATAAIARNCAPSARRSFRVDMGVGSFAVDGDRLYLANDTVGVVVRPLPRR